MEIKNLLVHIGYPKCGSTYFQKKLINMIPGTVLSTSNRNNLLPVDVLRGLRKKNISEKEIKNIIQKSCFFKNNISKNKSSKNFMITHEGIIGRMNTNLDEVSANNIKKISKNSKILIIIRNQFDLIQSLYTYKVSRKGTETRGFEEFLNDFLKNSDIKKKFNFFYTINFYIKLFGQKNVLIIPFEYLKKNEEKFLKDLNKFLNIKYHKKINIMNKKKNNYLNQSLKSKKILNLILIMNKIVMYISRKNKLRLGKHKIEIFRYTYRKFLSFLSEYVFFIYYKKKLELNKEEIFLKNKIKIIYKNSNKNLSKLIGINLNELGY